MVFSSCFKCCFTRLSIKNPIGNSGDTTTETRYMKQVFAHEKFPARVKQGGTYL